MEFHDSLKSWLISKGQARTTESGKRYYSRCYSGDSQPLDVRVGKRRFEFQPDVIFDKNGVLDVIELAFEEDWRAIVGEATMCSMVGRVEALMTIRYKENDTADEKVGRAISLLSEKYTEDGTIRNGVGVIFFPKGLSELDEARDRKSVV